MQNDTNKIPVSQSKSTNIFAVKADIGDGPEARAPLFECLFCQKTYRAHVTRNTKWFAPDGWLVCSPCAAIFEQLRNPKKRREPKFDRWQFDEDCKDETKGSAVEDNPFEAARTTASGPPSSTKRARFLRKLRKFVSDGEVTRFEPKKKREPQRPTDPPCWFHNSTLLEIFRRHLLANRRGVHKGFKPERTYAVAYFFWKERVVIGEIAERLKLTEKTIEMLLEKFRRRGDAFFRSRFFDLWCRKLDREVKALLSSVEQRRRTEWKAAYRVLAEPYPANRSEKVST